MKNKSKSEVRGAGNANGSKLPALKLGIICILTAVFALSALTGCFPARNPKNYYLNDSTALPAEIELGDYKLISLHYRNFKSSASYAEYFNHFKNYDVQIRNSVFQMGDAQYNAPKYHELAFEGIIRSAGTQNDKYRPVKAGEAKDFDMDESKHEVKRCIAVFDSDDKDTGYRIYIFDDELWLGFFDEVEDVEWLCEDIFVISKKKGNI